jgi:hypothetical protein
MSSLFFVGFFSLHAGRRVKTSYTKRNGDKRSAWHAHYKAAVRCRNSSDLPAEVRVYSPYDAIYSDNTFAFIIAKGFVPPANVGGEILLDAMHVAACPGNPADDNYRDSLPDFRWPSIFAFGNVSAPPTELPNRQVRFPISVSEYVRGSVKQSTIECVFSPVFLRFFLTLPKVCLQ